MTRRVLEPSERIAEVLFGLIMVLTFTGSLSVAEAGREDVRDMLVGALGCNVAWGIIDGILYLMSTLAERGEGLRTFHAVRQARDTRQAQALIAGALPPVIAQVLEPQELEAVHRRLQKLPEPPARAGLTATDWSGAFRIFLLVFLSTFPVALPFLFVADPGLALRVSNGVAIVLMFIAGIAYGRCIGRSPVLIGLAMVVLGAALVAMTMALGG
jgi:VIT family protein